MTIVLLSVNTDYLELIRSFFRFYKPQNGVTYKHFCPQAEALDYPEGYGLFSGYTEHWLDFKATNPLEDVLSNLNQQDDTALVFVDDDALEYWYSIYPQDDSVLYSSGYLSMLYSPDGSIPELDWLKLDSLTAKRLSCDSGCSLDGNIKQMLLRRQSTDLLITSNKDLVDFFGSLDPFSTGVYYPAFPMPTVNLELAAQEKDIIADRMSLVLEDLESYLSAANAQSVNASLSLGKDYSQRMQSSYSFFARQYDAYMSHVDYQSWVTNIITWHKKHGKSKPHRVLELACGTANIASMFVSDSCEVEACDLSRQMLEIAYRKHHKPLLFRRGMTEPLPRSDYDLIFCLFDSVNYLLKRSDFCEMLEQVYQGLKIGGVFIFDISTIYNSHENFNDSFNINNDAHGILLHQAEYDDFSFKQMSYLSYFRKTGLGYRIEREKHTQRVYRHYEIIDMLNSSSLSLKGIYTDQSRQNQLSRKHKTLDEAHPRLFYVLVKER